MVAHDTREDAVVPATVCRLNVASACQGTASHLKKVVRIAGASARSILEKPTAGLKRSRIRRCGGAERTRPTQSCGQEPTSTPYRIERRAMSWRHQAALPSASSWQRIAVHHVIAWYSRRCARCCGQCCSHCVSVVHASVCKALAIPAAQPGARWTGWPPVLRVAYISQVAQCTCTVLSHHSACVRTPCDPCRPEGKARVARAKWSSKAALPSAGQSGLRAKRQQTASAKAKVRGNSGLPSRLRQRSRAP